MPQNKQLAASQRDRLGEAIMALRDYEPLAVHVMELALLLDRLADIALEDVKAVGESHAGTDTSRAIEHLKEVQDERKHVRIEVAIEHVAQALRHLDPKTRR